ncbi:MAG: ATP-binding cassette domain-containing protein [Puniceicoccaceae bacterium]
MNTSSPDSLVLDSLAVHYLNESPASQSHRSDIWGQTVELVPHTFALVVAPSGTGKTTLVHCLSGVITPDQGTISLGGEILPPPGSPFWSELRSRKISTAYQNLNLIPELTGTENLRLAPFLDRDPMAFADRLGIGKRLHARVNQLSTGQRQRLSLCRSLARPYSLLILDEPFSHLDDRSAALAAELIEEEAASRAAIVLCTALSQRCPLSWDQTLHL